MCIIALVVYICTEHIVQLLHTILDAVLHRLLTDNHVIHTGQHCVRRNIHMIQTIRIAALDFHNNDILIIGARDFPCFRYKAVSLK